MLKYFQCVLFLFVLISIPTIIIYAGGKGFENEEVIVSKILATPSLGNMGEFEKIECSYANLDNSG